MAPKALYVHIPFCASICAYCDFCKLIKNDRFEDSYMESLYEELLSYKVGKVETIYVGGGTPTCLSDDSFERLLNTLSPYLLEGGEFTVEANPESLSDYKLKVMKECGVNRLSIGMESHDEGMLKLLGRSSFSVFLDAYERARKAGFENINVDLMIALPGETNEILMNDIWTLVSLHPEHISAYTLILEKDSIFGKKGYKEATDDVQADHYETVLRELRKAGYTRYEVSNYCLKGKESRHNLTYWHNEEYYGVGLGASGYIDGVRYTNTRSLDKYLKGERISDSEKVSKDDLESYFLLTNLRLADGFSLRSFEGVFGRPFLQGREEAVESLVADGLLVIADGRLKPSDKGLLLLDSVLLRLI